MRFVGRTLSSGGWRVWDRRGRRWWGETYRNRPDALIDELNGQKRPERLTELQRALASERVPDSES